MGAAWCRHRAERAQDSKSPLDRVIVRCVDKFYSVDGSATPVRIPKPTPGGAVALAAAARHDAEDGPEVVPLHSGPSRLAGAAGAWQKASLQVPRSEERDTSSSAPLTTFTIASSSSSSEEAPARTPVPPPRRKRQAKRKVGVSRPPPPHPPTNAENPQPITQLLSPPKSRPKNASTASMPEWRELDPPETTQQPPRPASTSPRPQYLRPPSLTSVSESTVERVETYLRRCRSFGSMPTGELVDRLSSIDADSDNEDPWEGVDDLDHAFHPAKGSPPHTPRSRVDGRKRRSGAAAASSTPKTETTFSPVTKRTSAFTPVAPSPPTENGITCGRFFVSSAEEEWFNTDYHAETKAESAVKNGPEKDLCEVKKELQSIIYDYNRTKKISTSSMEVLPTQPVRTPKKKKISVASLTPPPSPVASDLEDESTPTVPPSAIINGEATTDANTHSTLLRLLHECQNIEGALEDIGMEDSEMPRVHSVLRNMQENNRHLKETSKQTLRSLDSGLDVRGSLERAQEPPAAETADGTAKTIKNVDSGVDESDDLQTSPRTGKSVPSEVAKSDSVDAKTDGGVVRRHRDTKDNDGGSSSGRSSMTPSLSELEAALSDMLEKSAAAGDDDRASPIPPDRLEAAACAVAAAAAAAIPTPRAVTPVPPEPPASPAPMLIPKISVTHDNAPGVH